MSLDIIFGPMFAGKSSRILSIVSRYTSLGTRVLVVNHGDDVRYGDVDEVVTHDQRRIPCIRIHALNELSDDLIRSYDVVLVDEAQFFAGLVPFVERVVERFNKHLYLIGLDGDSNRRPFGDLLQCIPLADRIERLTAFCHRCANGTPGLFTCRVSGPADQQVIVGGQGMYEALCRRCYLRQMR